MCACSGFSKGLHKPSETYHGQRDLLGRKWPFPSLFARANAPGKTPVAVLSRLIVVGKAQSATCRHNSRSRGTAEAIFLHSTGENQRRAFRRTRSQRDGKNAALAFLQRAKMPCD